MPPPPPPPPPPPMLLQPPPPPPPLPLSGGHSPQPQGQPADRNGLLSEIRLGAALKKTTTNDKSKPMINGKSDKPNKPSSCDVGDSKGKISSGPAGLGDIFAQGMPKLKPTNKSFLQGGNYQSQLNPRKDLKSSWQKDKVSPIPTNSTSGFMKLSVETSFNEGFSKPNSIASKSSTLHSAKPCITGFNKPSMEACSTEGTSKPDSVAPKSSTLHSAKPSITGFNKPSMETCSTEGTSKPDSIATKSSSLHSAKPGVRTLPTPPAAQSLIVNNAKSNIAQKNSPMVKSYLHTNSMTPKLSGSEPALNLETTSRVRSSSKPLPPVPNVPQRNVSTSLEKPKLPRRSLEDSDVPKNLERLEQKTTKTPYATMGYATLRKAPRLPDVPNGSRPLPSRPQQRREPPVKPSFAPPPLPVKTPDAKVRNLPNDSNSPPHPPPPSVNVALAPPPPPPPRILSQTATGLQRNPSSTFPTQYNGQDASDFELKFLSEFQNVSKFGKPPTFSNKGKTYPSSLAKERGLMNKRTRQPPPLAPPPPPPLFAHRIAK